MVYRLHDYYLAGIEINLRTSKEKPRVSDYFKYKAKEYLKKKICVITGKPNTQLAHISKSAGALGGYKYDKGIGNSYLPLSIEWHIGVDHGVGGGRNKLMEKLKELNIEPFEIKTDEEVKELKKIYKGHFKGFKEEI